MRADLRKGWCPSVLRPMPSGDGLIVRLSLAQGALAPALARTIAHLADRFGNGLLDLSGRGNLQLRGISEATLRPLQAELDAQGLMQMEEAPAVARNILASPLAGLDPRAVIAAGPCVEALRAGLRGEPLFHDLPVRFSFVLDDGGTLSVAGEKADVSFLAHRGATRRLFRIRLAGIAAGACEAGEVAQTGVRIARVYLVLRRNAQEGMAACVRRVGIAAFAAAAGFVAAADRVERRSVPRPIGAYRVGQHHVLGVGLAFGRLDGAALLALADAAQACGSALRLTPWRAVLIVGARPPGLPPGDGLIFSEDDPLRAVAACPGAPACVHGTTATQDDARRLAPLARRLRGRGISVHVSGCAKGCAHPGAAPVTFIGCDGRYDLVLDGRAGDAPRIAGLGSEQMDVILRHHARKMDA